VIVTGAFRVGDLRMLGEGMTDKLHQPYRLPLIPEAQAAMDAMKQAAAAAVALSAAGPGLIAFSSRSDQAFGRNRAMYVEDGLEMLIEVLDGDRTSFVQDFTHLDAVIVM